MHISISQFAAECVGEQADGLNITAQCGIDIVFNNIYQVDYNNGQLTGVLSKLPQYKQCFLVILFSNNAGNSEPLLITLRKQQ